MSSSALAEAMGANHELRAQDARHAGTTEFVKFDWTVESGDSGRVASVSRMPDSELGTSVAHVSQNNCPCDSRPMDVPKCPRFVPGTVVPLVNPKRVPLQHPGHGHTLKGVCAVVAEGG